MKQGLYQLLSRDVCYYFVVVIFWKCNNLYSEDHLISEKFKEAILKLTYIYHRSTKDSGEIVH